MKWWERGIMREREKEMDEWQNEKSKMKIKMKRLVNEWSLWGANRTGANEITQEYEREKRRGKRRVGQSDGSESSDVKRRDLRRRSWKTGRWDKSKFRVLYWNICLLLFYNHCSHSSSSLIIRAIQQAGLCRSSDVDLNPKYLVAPPDPSCEIIY